MINHDYRFIFIRNAKSGSTSIVENWSPGYVSSKLPDHMVLPGTSTWKHDKNHIPLSHVKQHMSDKKFNEYFKFGFVRNPYDRVVSAYRYTTDWYQYHENSKPYVDLKDFVKKLFTTDKFLDESVKYGPQHVFLQGCDQIGRFENMQRDYNIICEKLDVYPRRLSHENKNYPWRYLPKHGWSEYQHKNPLSDTKHYTEYYDQDTKDLVTRVFDQDLQQYNYDFK